MKKSELQQIIKEEITNSLNEANSSSIERINKVINLLEAGDRMRAMKLVYEWTKTGKVQYNEFESYITQFEHFKK